MKRARPAFGLITLLAVSTFGITRMALADDAAKSREPGGTAIVTAAATATVKAVDTEKRIVTLQTSDGDVTAIKCDKEARNFDQIQVGDEVHAVAIAKLVVSVRSSAGPAPKPEAGVIFARSPKGAKPGGILTSTEEVTAKVESVDADKQTVTLKTEAGESQAIKVAPDVDLSKVKPDDQVLVRVTKGVALWVTAPEGARTAAEKVKSAADEKEPFVMDSSTVTMKITAIDPAKRTVTLKTPSGATSSIHLGAECVNFDQIKVGDQVRTTVAEEVALSIRKKGEEAARDDVAGTAVTLAPKGAKPGMFITDTEVITAKIKSIDTAKKTIALTEEDGDTRIVKTGPNVKLSELKEGDDVTARITQAMAIVVQKPT